MKRLLCLGLTVQWILLQNLLLVAQDYDRLQLLNKNCRGLDFSRSFTI